MQTVVPTEPTDNLITTKDAALLLAVSPRTLEAWRLRGGGPRYVCLTNGRTVRYRKSDIDAFIVAHLQNSTSNYMETDDD
jgi:hypothetical protein